jgi:hypothetical protein
MAVTAQVVVPFSQSLFVYRMQVVFGDTEPVFFPPTAAVFTPPPFSESPLALRKSTPLYPWTDISFLQIAYTPGPLAFSEPQWRIVPRRPFDQAGFQFLPTINTWGMFSEQRAALKAPRPFEQQPWWEFPIAVATPNIWGMFAESPYQIRRATPLYPWSDISFLQVAYTQGPLAFSESQWTFVKSKPFDQPGFVVLPTAVVTPSVWGMFSESQWAFRKPVPLYPWADISFLQISYTPTLWGMFSESPLAQKKPMPSLVPYVDLPTLPIRLVPLVFSESPTRVSPPRALLPWADIALLQIAYTPSAFGFSESQWAFRRPFQLQQWSDISFLQISYTPGPLTFSESPLSRTAPRPFDQPGFQFVPTVAATPTALTFSESPFALKMPFILRQWADYPWLPIQLVPLVFSESPLALRRPKALLQWADIAFLQIAYTPGPLVFSESPYATVKAKALLQWADISFLLGAPTPSIFWMGQREDALMLVRPSIAVTILSPTGNISWLQPPIFVARGFNYGYIIG